jgi:hypothetical protein
VQPPASRQPAIPEVEVTRIRRPRQPTPRFRLTFLPNDRPGVPNGIRTLGNQPDRAEGEPDDPGFLSNIQVHFVA